MAGYSGDKLTSASYDNLSGGYCKPKFETTAKNRFRGKTIIVTGGAGNFGKSCALRMASEGCNVALWDLVDATGVARQLEEKYAGVKAVAFQIDITDAKAVAETAARVKAEFGQIHYLFNNAGYQGQLTKAENYDPEDFKKVLDINVNGVFYVLQAVANIMKDQDGGGAIVNTASMAGHGAPANMIAYGSSKAAVLHMTKIAAKDYAPSNIRVNSISPAFIGPGFMWTRQIELQAAVGSEYYDTDPEVVAKQMVGSTWFKRYGSIEEVMGPVTFLLSDDASYLTGQDIQITGGM